MLLLLAQLQGKGFQPHFPKEHPFENKHFPHLWAAPIPRVHPWWPHRDIPRGTAPSPAVPPATTPPIPLQPARAGRRNMPTKSVATCPIRLWDRLPLSLPFAGALCPLLTPLGSAAALLRVYPLSPAPPSINPGGD